MAINQRQPPLPPAHLSTRLSPFPFSIFCAPPTSLLSSPPPLIKSCDNIPYLWPRVLFVFGGGEGGREGQKAVHGCEYANYSGPALRAD